MRASLADQSLAIALGANLPSQAGEPIATLVAVRPLIEDLLQGLQPDAPSPGWLRWSPLFRTVPMGGPPEQPFYVNAVVLAEASHQPDNSAALQLLERLQDLERRFARVRHEHWGPRSLDLDLLWWGSLRCSSASLALPHPRLQERPFVLAPLAAIAPNLVPPDANATATVLLGRLTAGADEQPVLQLPHQRDGPPDQPAACIGCWWKSVQELGEWPATPTKSTCVRPSS